MLHCVWLHHYANLPSLSQAVSKVLFEMSAEGVVPHEGVESQDKVHEGVPLKLSINRPFFFSVIEGNSNAILLLGKITTL